MKVLSLTLITLAGMLISTHALPGPPPKPEISISQAKADNHKFFPSIKTTNLNFAAPGELNVTCYDTDRQKSAADGQYPLREVGKDHDLEEKNIYEVAGRFCAESNDHELAYFTDISTDYLFKNAFQTFPLPFVPVTMGIINIYENTVRVDAKQCTDMLTKIISDCTAPGKPSRLDHFMGGDLEQEGGLSYAIGCFENYCVV